MIARAAESNPTCFSLPPLSNVEKTLSPAYIRLVPCSHYFLSFSLIFTPQAKYFDHNWGLTKFCVSQFKGKHVDFGKAAQKRYREILNSTKGFDGLEEIVGSWTGEEDFKEIVKIIEARPPRGCGQEHPAVPSDAAESRGFSPPKLSPLLVTPTETVNPEPPSSGAPLMLALQSLDIPALNGRDPLTPTPGGNFLTL